MIFTSNPAPPRVSPPEIFRSHGNTTDAPTPLSDVFLFALATTPSELWTGFTSHIGVHMYATSIGKFSTTSDNGFYDIKLNVPITGFVSPRVGFSFSRKVTEEMDNQLTRLGFSKEATARSTIYSGLITPDNATAVVKLQPDMDAYVPYGTTTLRGYMAYVMTTNILDLAFKTIPYPSGSSPGNLNLQGGGFTLGYDAENKSFYHLKEGYSNTAALKKPQEILNGMKAEDIYSMNGASYVAQPTLIKSRTFSFSDPSTITSGGLFFPYFHGLNTEDKTFAAQILSKRFMNILGKDVNDALKKAEGLKAGFRTLSMTNAGKELSHMVACLDIALNCGAKPHAYVLPNGDYLGCVLLGTMFSVTKNGKTYEPISKEELMTELNDYNSHDAAIVEICRLMNGLSTEKQPVKVTPLNITGPRAIHNIVRKLSIPNDTMKDLRLQFAKLSFKVNYLSGHKIDDLLAALIAVKTGDHFDDSHPAVLTSPLMFSDNIIDSTLMAFGQIAPSFIDKSGRVLPIVDAQGKLLVEAKVNNKPVLPRGVPVYLKPLQDACADWKAMAKSTFIQVKVTSNGHYANTSRTFIKNEGLLLSKRLSETFARDDSGKTKKRTIRDVEEAESSKAKKVKVKNNELGGFFDVEFEEQEMAPDEEALEMELSDDE